METPKDESAFYRLNEIKLVPYTPPPAWVIGEDEAANWRELRLQAFETLRRYDLATVRRQGLISRDNRHSCTSCYCCACAWLYQKASTHKLGEAAKELQ